MWKLFFATILGTVSLGHTGASVPLLTDSNQDAPSIKDFSAAMKLLMDAAAKVSFDKADSSVNWGRHNRKMLDDLKLVQGNVGLTCDFYEYDPEEHTLASKAFTEDAILFAFNKVRVAHDVEATAYGIHLLPEPNKLEGEVETKNANIRSGDSGIKQRGRKKYPPARRSYDHNSDWSCRLCGNDRRGLATRSGDGPGFLNDWAREVIDTLRGSRFSIFQSLDTCFIEVDIDFDAGAVVKDGAMNTV